MKTYLTLDKQLRAETDPTIIANLERKGWVKNIPPSYNEETHTLEFENGQFVVKPIILPSYSANEWLELKGYNSVVLVTLLDLETKLKEADKVSSKLIAVRGWINSILSQYIQDSSPKSNWNNAPYSVQETVSEAFGLLNS